MTDSIPRTSLSEAASVRSCRPVTSLATRRVFHLPPDGPGVRIAQALGRVVGRAMEIGIGKGDVMKSVKTGTLRMVGLLAVCILAAGGLWAAQQSQTKLNLPIAPGPFQPEFESFAQYQCPEWFRDAKLGMWAHWGPQAVPMMGDWYAKHMYVQGHPQYKHHLETYGHPSTNGYKDIIPLWKAEKWDPDRLIALYKKAGARYFVSMGSHHDNFYLWNSQLHKWNSVNMGPKRDVVGDWQKAAKKQGLYFGVSEHLGASFTWFQDQPQVRQDRPQGGRAVRRGEPQVPGSVSFPRRARRQGVVQHQSPLAAAVVRPHQGVGGQLPPRSAVHRRRHALRQRGRSQPDRPLLQRRRPEARRQAPGRSTPASRTPRACGSTTSNAASCPASARRPGRPTPPSATGTTTRTGSTAARTGSSRCSSISSARTATS